ncbi:MAG TPA: hypothetical protein PK867_05015 [Pirellulales bacterium]|nr:hypothetical protein [Pirellulales bacterium]
MILATPASKAQAAGAVRQEGGQPLRRFVKEIIRAGRYVKDADGQAFSVTPEMLDRFAASTSSYLKAGNKIPMPVTHTDDPEANRGWVRDVYRDGDSLYATCDLVGEDGIRLAGTCDVSIFAPPEYVDGSGNRYQWPILHVALCTDPVVAGLAGFVPVQTSQSKQPAKAPVFRFSKESTMPVDPMNPMPTPQGAAPIKADADAVETDPFDAVIDAIENQYLPKIRDKATDPKTRKQLAGEMAKKFDQAIKLLGEETDEDPAASDDDAAAVEACKEGAKMSRGRIVDPVLVRFAAEKYRGDLAGLVRDRKIAPAVAKRLEASYIGNGQPLALSLSRSASGLTELDSIIGALKENTAVPAVGEKTGPQGGFAGGFAMSNPLAGGGDADPETKAAIEFMQSRIGMKKPA